MSEIERNKQLARDFFGALGRGDVAAIIDAYAEDGTVQTMGNTLISGVFDKSQIRQAAGAIFEAFPSGLEFTIHHLTAEGDRNLTFSQFGAEVLIEAPPADEVLDPLGSLGQS